jgi:hypothetical protein
MQRDEVHRRVLGITGTLNIWNKQEINASAIECKNMHRNESSEYSTLAGFCNMDWDFTKPVQQP